MINKIRIKFVIVTMSMLVVVFGVLGIVNYLVNEHWNTMESIGMLEWIAESGVFTRNSDDRSKNLLMELTDEEDSITGVIVNSDGKVVSTQRVGNKKAKEVPGNIIDRIIHEQNTKRSVDGYLYTKTKLSDEEILIVIMDLSVYQNSTLKTVYLILLIISGLAILLIIAFLLSRFVTEPARQALEREKRFIADASHELKTPISAISINAQAIEIQGSNEIYIRNIISESARMGRMIERLLMLSKYDERKDIERTELSLSDICEEMALTYESIAYEKKVNYSYDVDPGIQIYGNDDELRQLLAILIDNAVKNTEEDGYLKISCRKVLSKAQIEVRNTGKGISDEDLPHVFERFYTSDKSRNGNSFGLGLAIAKTIVERHRGQIYVYNTESKETVFVVNL